MYSWLLSVGLSLGWSDVEKLLEGCEMASTQVEIEPFACKLLGINLYEPENQMDHEI